MLITIKGYYQEGKVILEEVPPVTEKTEVFVTFLTEEKIEKTKQRRLGSLQGQGSISDNFNDPLDDLKEYM